jgi:hypothetical protein
VPALFSNLVNISQRFADAKSKPDRVCSGRNEIAEKSAHFSLKIVDRAPFYAMLFVSL